jgi:hypothetical protein
MSARRLLSAFVFGGLLSVASAAGAEALGSHQPHVQASLGVRASRVSDAGYDPFASTDELSQVSLGVGGTILREQRFSLSAVGFWDYGTQSSTARGQPSSLALHRLTIGPEARYHLLPPLYVFVHVLPAFGHTTASIDDGVAQVARSARHWSYGVDAAAGAAYELYGMRSGESIRPRIWALAEAGYGYLGRTSLRLKPAAGDGAPERSSVVDLGSVSLAGPYLRVSAAVSF